MSHHDTWAADPGIGWRILLTADLPHRPRPDDVADLLAALYRDQGWGAAPAVTVGGSPDGLRTDLAEARPAPVLVGTAGTSLVISAHHGAADGLGLLRVLEALGPSPVSSDVRRPGARPPGGGRIASVARRLVEVAATPPARLRPASPAGGSGDVMAEATVTGGRRTTEIVVAATAAAVEHERSLGRSGRHVAIAVGVGSPHAPGAPIADRSGLLRVRDAERLDAAAIREAVRSAPLEAAPTRGMSVGLRLLAPRLGSTLLVSHLGVVDAPAVERLAFHPVTAGGSGISLGAVTHRDVTTFTLRARAAVWDADGLERLLEAVVSRL
ncbi:hypothetical protein HNR19_001740 [Nocardioides thalensis]|uniref:Uncharacterized protein n=1 Tax=Nocardioides thalensis TaxID=1914755 RepID=A0A853C2X9_9ACTN|nr:hypothetical protein [Nocardioides thalensis]NYJ01042.1 hypothetical protein [Nocardioides thalensis]